MPIVCLLNCEMEKQKIKVPRPVGERKAVLGIFFWKLLLLLLIAYSVPSYAYIDNYPIGARSMALGNSSVTFSDVWSIHHNQAGLAFQKDISAGIFYESKFLVPQMGLKGGVIAVPTSSGVFGLNLVSFGYSQYNESKFGLAYARTFGESLSFGLQLDYLRTQIAENYGNKGVIAGEAGVQARLTRNLILGAHIFNLNRATGADNNEKIPTIMRAGLGYTFSDKVLVSVETEKDIDFNPIIKFGLEYHVIEALYLRAGASSQPFMSSFGVGVFVRNFQLDLAASMHPILGYSSQISLSYVLEKKEKQQKKKSAASKH